MVRGFTCGTFDLLHAGHILMFREIKEQCDYLIVGIQTDPSFRPGKNNPIQSIDERKLQLEGVRFVEQVGQYDTEEDLVDLLKMTKPDLRFVGMDWKNNPNLTGGDLPIEIRYNSRDHGFSSSELRKRVLTFELEKMLIKLKGHKHERTNG